MSLIQLQALPHGRDRIIKMVVKLETVSRLLFSTESWDFTGWKGLEYGAWFG